MFSSSLFLHDTSNHCKFSLAVTTGHIELFRRNQFGVGERLFRQLAPVWCRLILTCDVPAAAGRPVRPTMCSVCQLVVSLSPYARRAVVVPGKLSIICYCYCDTTLHCSSDDDNLRNFVKLFDHELVFWSSSIFLRRRASSICQARYLVVPFGWKISFLWFIGWQN